MNNTPIWMVVLISVCAIGFFVILVAIIMAFFKFICTEHGHTDEPCEHWERHQLIRIENKLDTLTSSTAILYEQELLSQEEQRKCCKLIEAMLLEIIHLLNRPTSATLTIQGGIHMPATIQVGGTASSLFQEWTGPNGTGSVVPNAGAIAFSSDNAAVATVDPGTGVVTGVAAGTANIMGVDQANNLSASDVVTVQAAAAQSATLTLTAN